MFLFIKNIVLKKAIKYFWAIFLVMLFCGINLLSKNKLDSDDMDESSGLASSKIHENLLYTHNDSGDSSRFFAVTTKGELKETFNFTGDPTLDNGVKDCEDIAVGPGPVKSKSYIYLGDIGDNGRIRKYISIYRFQEPAISEQKTTTLIKSRAIQLKYPDGPRDAETLMIDPIDKLIYIITKREDSVGIYTAPLNPPLNDTVTLEKRGTVHFEGVPGLKWITAGDISFDGSQILIKSYEKVFYWKRDAGEPVWKTLQKPYIELPYTLERQGEAISFNTEGNAYFTTSEGRNATIFKYAIPK